MLDISKVKADTEKEVREEAEKRAKESIKSLLRKKAQAMQVCANIERELADAYAELGKGNFAEPSG